MEASQKDNAWTVWSAMTLCLWGITAGAFFLFVQEVHRTDKFWLTLCGLMLSEGLVMLLGLGRMWRMGGATGEARAAAGFSLVTYVYALGVGLLTLVALLPITFKTMAGLHLLWLAVIVLGLASSPWLAAPRTIKPSRVERNFRICSCCR